MRILAFGPPSRFGGNATTLRRIGRELEARGHAFTIHVVGPDATPDALRVSADEERPDVLHFYHAWQTGRFLPGLASRPTVLTLAGTDINEDRRDPARRAAIDAALAAAGVVIAYNPAFATMARVIPKGVELGTTPYALRRAAGIRPDETLILQAGGIRPVKNNLFALKALHGNAIRLVFLGPILDPDYGREFQARLAEEPRAVHLPAISSDAMASAYAGADLVLNTSLSEGLSNTLIEAMALGKAVVASDVVGNRELLRDVGKLYRTEEELREHVGMSREAREALGAAARAHAEQAFSTAREVDALLQAYEDAMDPGFRRIRC